MDFLDLKKKKILVTGASSGIGLAVSRALSKLGATVVLVARDAEKLALAEKSLDGNNHKILPMDLSIAVDLKKKTKGTL